MSGMATQSDSTLDPSALRILDEVAPVCEIIVRDSGTTVRRAIRTKAQYERAVAVSRGLSRGITDEFIEAGWMPLVDALEILTEAYDAGSGQSADLGLISRDFSARSTR